MQEHQRQEAPRLGLVGHQLDQDPTQPDGFGTELATDHAVPGRRAVALVEDQVDDRHHRGQAFGEQVVGRDPEGDAGVPDLPLGPHQPLGHGRIGHQEGSGDLLGGQSAQGPEREGHAGFCGQGRMAAREHQAQPVVGDGAHATRAGGRVPALLERRHGRQLLPFLGQALLPAQSVDRLVPGGRGDPGAGVVRDAVRRPPLERHGERFLDGLLGQVEVAQDPDEGGDRPSLFLPEHAVDHPSRIPGLLLEGWDGSYAGCSGASGNTWHARTSTAPHLAPGIRAAACTASSSLWHSTR